MKRNSGLLPRLHRKNSHITRSQQTIFGGLSSSTTHSGKDIIYMEGLSVRAYPALSTMEKRFHYDISSTAGLPHGLHAHDELIMARGRYLYAITSTGACTTLCSVTDTDKTFVSFGSKLFVLPDRICVDTANGTVRSLDVTTGRLTDVTLGTQYVTHGLTDWKALGFEVGDAVKLSIDDYILGGTTVFERKITAISMGTLFLDAPFERTGSFQMKVSRSFPSMTQMCVLGDRLVGCGGNTVYISEAGNPYNWSVASGREEDPLMLETGGEGDIVACALWQESIVFFKENRAYQLIGHGAGDYLLLHLPIPGVAVHSPYSLCHVDGKLYYLSSGGVYCFDGGYPQHISAPLPQNLARGVGGSDGCCYYLVAWGIDGVSRVYVYHDENRQWYIQDMLTAHAMATCGDRLYIQTTAGSLLCYPRPGEKLPDNQTVITEAASALPSCVVFGSESGGTPDGVRLLAVYLSVASAEDSPSMNVSVSYDGGEWITVGIIPGGTSGTVHLPVYPQRAQAYRLKLTMPGMWKVMDITCDYERGKQ